MLRVLILNFEAFLFSTIFPWLILTRCWSSALLQLSVNLREGNWFQRGCPHVGGDKAGGGGLKDQRSAGRLSADLKLVVRSSSPRVLASHLPWGS